MPRSNLRTLCFEALAEWDRKKSFADTIIESLAGRHRLEGRDRAFLGAVVRGVLRNLALLDHHIEEMRRGSLSHRTRWILRIGLYQILEMRIPDHAAVGETVALARSRGEKALVNAVLRRAAREKPALLETAETLPLSTRYSVPDFLLDRWAAAFGEADTATLCRWNNEPAPIWVRKNALRPDAREAACAATGATVHSTDARFFQVREFPEEWIANGCGYIQDPSTAMACDLLAAQPGETVLDACAAPGGKTCLLAEQMENTGHLLATDADATRLERVAENIERLGVTNAEIARVDWLNPTPEVTGRLRESFDAILVDAPCTNTGVMRRRVDVRWRLTEKDFARMAESQRAILENTLPTLRPGGRLVYSTCSLEPEENEAVIQRLLSTHKDLELVETARRLPFVDQMDGAFAALFRLLPQHGG